MALDEALLLSVRDGVVELTAQVLDPSRVEAGALVEAARERVREHRQLAMTDPAILDGAEDLGLATVLEARSPLDESLHGPLTGIGFAPEAAEVGGRARGGVLGWMSRGRKAQLERWRHVYQRPHQVRPDVGVLESELRDLVDLDDPGSPYDLAEKVREAGARAFGLELRPDLESLEALERASAFEAQDRLVLEPTAVAGLTGFLTACVLETCSGARFEPGEEFPVLIQGSAGGPPLSTDPEWRIIDWVMRGARASPTAYVRQLTAEIA